jgi:hypothetical protein
MLLAVLFRIHQNFHLWELDSLIDWLKLVQKPNLADLPLHLQVAIFFGTVQREVLHDK